MRTVVKSGRRVAPKEKREVIKKTFDFAADLAFGLKRLAVDESEREGRSVSETEIVQRLVRAELERARTKK